MWKGTLRRICSTSLTEARSSAILIEIYRRGFMAQKKKTARNVALVGLGYVGLPIAVAFGKRGKVIGFDINKAKIAELQSGFDRTGEVSADDLKTCDVYYTSDPTDLKAA